MRNFPSVMTANELRDHGFIFIKFAPPSDEGYYCLELDNGRTVIYKEMGDGFYTLHGIPDARGNETKGQT